MHPWRSSISSVREGRPGRSSKSRPPTGDGLERGGARFHEQRKRTDADRGRRKFQQEDHAGWRTRGVTTRDRRHTQCRDRRLPTDSHRPPAGGLPPCAISGSTQERDRPVAAVRFLAGRCGAASSNRSFVHRAAFSEGEGRQSGQSTSSMRLLERPLWGESKFKWQSARWVAPGTSFSSHLEIT